MKYHIIPLIALCLLFSCKAKPTETPALETKISGKVVDKDNNNAIVGAQITTNPTTSSVSTDGSGSYTIPDVKAGQYVVSASKIGYSSNSINVVVTEGKTSSADIQLETVKPGLSLSAQSLDFGTTQTTATFIIGNATSIGSINYSIAKSVDWLSLSATSGTITTGTATITVTASRTNLSFGNYSTTLSITSNGGNKDVTVTMTVANPNAPQLTVSPLLLDFSTNLSQLTFTVRNSGTGKIDWATSSVQQWISILPSKDSTRTEVDQVTVTVNRNSLPPTDYTGEIIITSNAGSQTVNVKMNVPAVPSLSLTVNTLDFDSAKTQLSFNVNNAGSGSLLWSVSGNQTWMTVAPPSGTNSGTVNVTANRSGLSAGSYSGTVSVTSNGGNASVIVDMKVTPPPAPQPVTVTAGGVTTNSIAISWTGSTASDFSAYKVYYATSAAVSENSTLATTIVNKATTSYTITGLTSNTTYYFRVFVLSSSQQIAGSNTETAKTERTFPTWQQVALPVNFQVQSMHYIAESNIWVAGYTTISNYNFPRIYQFNGSVWTQSNVQGQDSVGVLTSIAFRNNSEGWTASGDRIYKYDGSSWIVQRYLLSDSYSGIFEALSTTTDVWFYGKKLDDPIIYQWNGSNFIDLVPTTLSQYISDMHFYNKTTGFAIDNNGNSFMYNGIGWISLDKPSQTYGTPYSISGVSKNDVWSSDYYYLYHYNGTNWKMQTDIGGAGINYSFTELRMFSATEGWAIRKASPYEVYYYNGTTWSKIGTVSGKIEEIKDFGNGNFWGIIYESSSSNKLMRLQ